MHECAHHFEVDSRPSYIDTAAWAKKRQCSMCMQKHGYHEMNVQCYLLNASMNFKGGLHVTPQTPPEYGPEVTHSPTKLVCTPPISNLPRDCRHENLDSELSFL